MPWLYISKDEVLQIAQSRPEIGARFFAALEEDNSEAANECRSMASDNEEFAPEWDGAVSFCDDGKAWVMTWQLVDNPCAESDED